MPGAWEREHTSVLVATLHTEFTTIAWALALRRLIIPGPIPPAMISGLPFDHARNAAAMSALDSGAEWLFFLDSDVITPRDAIVRLIAHQQPIMSGLYFRRSPPVGVPVMQRPPGQWVTQYPKGQVIEVDVVGCGCLLIHREVLEKLPPQRPEAGKHWFDWRVDCQSLQPVEGVPHMSEDFTMCLWAKKHGFRTLVDTSVVCKHIGLSQATDQGYGALDLSPI